jgi:hypothetical protein
MATVYLVQLQLQNGVGFVVMPYTSRPFHQSKPRCSDAVLHVLDGI